MNQEELRDFFEKYEVPYIDTGAGLAMESWGKMPRHIQEMMKHREQTGGRNRSERRKTMSHAKRTRWHHEQSPER